jgi:hypothetical protein
MKPLRMSRFGVLTVAALACVLLLTLALPKPKIRKPQLVDGARIVKAFARYNKDAAQPGESPPSSVTLGALVRRGYLTSQDVKPFEGAKVTFCAGADETTPQSVVCVAQMPDGTIEVVLADGSIQGLTRSRWQEYLTNLGQPNARYGMAYLQSN